MRSGRWILAGAVGGLIALGGAAFAGDRLPGDFVHLREVAPTILQDIRYAGAHNFVGRPLPGYEAAECIVTRRVAARLALVQQDLAADGLSLKMLDCYRPARAVAEMVRWSQDGRETAEGRTYNPKLRKADLFRLGYIATTSGHSTGSAVDLTLVDRAAPTGPAWQPGRRYADCTAPAAQRAPEGAVDMGTGYDCSDDLAHTAAAVGPAQQRWRQRLVGAMTRRGFVNFAKEWWHFSLPGGGREVFDFPITASRQTER
jgi:D-alanyl-D-alanine dipeptidase